MKNRVNIPLRGVTSIMLAALLGIHHVRAMDVVRYEVYKVSFSHKSGQTARHWQPTCLIPLTPWQVLSFPPT